MAQFTIEIPDDKIDRVKTALKRLLVEGEAIDLENPTNVEIRDKAKSICVKHLKAVLKEQATILNYENFVYELIDIS